MKKLVAALALGAGLLCTANAYADSLPELFARGNAAFARGEYPEAVRSYEALIEAGVDDPDVAFNLASAYGAQGQYGQAIRYFERTLRLAPRDTAARTSLQTAREALGERQAQAHGEAIVVDRPPLTEAIFAPFSADTLAFVLLCMSWLSVGLFIALRLRGPASSADARNEAVALGMGIASAIALALALICALGLGAKADWGRDGVRALVLRDSTALREGPDDRARLTAELAEGEAVRVLSREGLFTRIVARSGQPGYVRSELVGEI